MTKLIPIILLLFVVTLLQMSFLPGLMPFGIVPNLAFVIYFCVIFFEDPSRYQDGLMVTIAAGFFLDVFFSPMFGVAIGSLLAIYALVKVSYHFLNDQQGPLLFFSFVILFVIGIVAYSAAIEYATGSPIIGNSAALLVTVAYNLLAACLGFYGYQISIRRSQRTKQLKLL